MLGALAVEPVPMCRSCYPILNIGTIWPRKAEHLTQGHVDSSLGQHATGSWLLTHSAVTHPSVPAIWPLSWEPGRRYPTGSGCRGSPFQGPHPPALKAPFMGLLHTPLGKPDKTASVGIIFLFPDGSVCWLHPGPPITAWGPGAQRQVNIRRQQEKTAAQCSSSEFWEYSGAFKGAWQPGGPRGGKNVLYFH